MKIESLYLDHAATTPMAPEVFSKFTSLLQEGIGNSSSGHAFGTHALALLNQARNTLANRLGCSAKEIIFTSGGTEGNNWILQRVVEDAAPAMRAKGLRPHIITSAIEHSSIINVAEWLKRSGIAEWSKIAADGDGRIDASNLALLIQPNTVLVSILHGNNEIGTIQNLQELGQVCRARNVLFHSDACQTFCHESFNVSELPVDFLSLSGHKIRGPKGIGAIYIRAGLELTPLLFGGKQERGLRPGTTSVELICAFAAAAELWNQKSIEAMHAVRRYAIDRLKSEFPDVRINGPIDHGPTLCHVVSFTLNDLHSKTVHRALADVNVACSTGAACGTGASDSSAVLLAIGRTIERAHQIRISFSPETTCREIDVFIGRLSGVVQKLISAS